MNWPLNTKTKLANLYIHHRGERAIYEAMYLFSVLDVEELFNDRAHSRGDLSVAPGSS
jgi:hypothetical protein